MTIAGDLDCSPLPGPPVLVHATILHIPVDGHGTMNALETTVHDLTSKSRIKKVLYQQVKETVLDRLELVRKILYKKRPCHHQCLLMVVITGIRSVVVTPLVRTEYPELQGFLVKGYRNTAHKKTGLLLNAVRYMEFYHASAKITARIRWLSGELVELEEFHGGTGRHPYPVQFHVNVNDSSHQVLRGHPDITRNVFTGKSILIDWSTEDPANGPVFKIKTADSSFFSCNVNTRRKTIDVQLEQP
ncbi:MAG: hypothetical protein ACFFD4_12510 [Candidatus Odinarchaeota archaeon]